MNKTRQRAIQKHRAKKIKFEIRQKSEGQHGTTRGRTSMATAAAPSPAPQAAAARPKSSTRRKETEAPEPEQE